MKANNEKGMTLVEILAALTILGIVFVGFMTIFPQMNLFNQKTETKLVSMNIAKQVLTSLKSSTPGLDPDLDVTKKVKDSTSSDPFEKYDFSDGDYDTGDNFTILMDCYDKDSQTCSGKGDAPRKKNLYKIHIKVEKDGKLNSETFGYLELK